MAIARGAPAQRRRPPLERPVPSVSAIVPLFNEQTTVARVVETLAASRLIEEVICVDDGSTDESRAVLEAFGERIVLVACGSNGGKGQALADGLSRARGGIVAFFDADLTNLSEAHVEALLAPILGGEARAVLGYPNGTTPYPGSVLARFTGERAYFRDDLQPHLARMADVRFGIEVLLNSLVADAETRLVPLEGLAGLDKLAKHGSQDAVREYWGEAVEITRELARQRLAAIGGHPVVAYMASIAGARERRK
jgi:polyisoprenyl-phosphate glycosyltransferase